MTARNVEVGSAEHLLRELVAVCRTVLEQNDRLVYRDMLEHQAQIAERALEQGIVPRTLHRPEIERFADAMEEGCRKHDHDRGRRGWANDPALDLLLVAYRDMGDLTQGLFSLRSHDPEAADYDENRGSDRKYVRRKAIAAANRIMMALDVAGALEP